MIERSLASLSLSRKALVATQFKSIMILRSRGKAGARRRTDGGAKAAERAREMENGGRSEKEE